MEIITSAQNPFVKKVKKLGTSKKFREDEGSIILDGVHLVEEWLKYNTQIELLLSESFYKSDDYKKFKNTEKQTQIPDDLMSKVAPTKTPQGILGIVPLPKTETIKATQKALILDQLQDPGNIGTIIRTSVAAGYETVFLYKCADTWSPKSLRAGQGSQFNPHIQIIENLTPEEIRKAYDGKIYGMSLNQESQNFLETEIKTSSAFALGNEGQGLSTEIQSICDEFLYIPMANNCESLNVGVTAGICLFRQ